MGTYIQGRINNDDNLKIQGVGDTSHNRSYGVSAVEEITGNEADAIENSAPFNQTSVRTDKPYTLLSVKETLGTYVLVETMSNVEVGVTDEDLEAFIEENEEDLRAAGAFIEEQVHMPETTENDSSGDSSGAVVQGRINAENNLKLQGIGGVTVNRDYGVSDVIELDEFRAKAIEEHEPFDSTSEASSTAYTELTVVSTLGGFDLVAENAAVNVEVPKNSDMYSFLEANGVGDSGDDTTDEAVSTTTEGDAMLETDGSTNGESEQPLDALAEETLRNILTDEEVSANVKVAAALDVLESA